MNVKIEVIPHDQQRYNTCGDWTFEPNGDLLIRVSRLSHNRLEMLVAVHELIEVLLCQRNGVTQEQVDKFDMQFEEDRKRKIELCVQNADAESGALAEIAEPGDDALAPYRTEHCFATAVERMLAAALGVVWADYETELESLP